MVPEPSASIYQTPKCFVTYGTLGHVDSDQSSSSRKPWSILKTMGFIQKVDLILPQESAAAVRQHLQSATPPRYSRVRMTLGQILERQFFTLYVKEGHILMLTRGKKAIDDMFTLQDGTLTMYLGKESYEKAGLVGRPYGAKGNRKLKPRWIISLDLKSSSMLHGKKGFDRLIYACENVFSKPFMWLFCNVSTKVPTPDPLQQYSPEHMVCEPIIRDDAEAAKIDMRIDPSVVSSGDRPALEIAATDLYEWLSLIRLDSPRIRTCDSIDVYLSRYEAPGVANVNAQLCIVSWEGLIASTWLQQLAMSVVSELPQQGWLSISATELSGSLSGASREVTLLRPDQPKGEYMVWEIQGSE